MSNERDKRKEGESVKNGTHRETVGLYVSHVGRCSRSSPASAAAASQGSVCTSAKEEGGAGDAKSVKSLKDAAGHVTPDALDSHFRVCFLVVPPQLLQRQDRDK